MKDRLPGVRKLGRRGFIHPGVAGAGLAEDLPTALNFARPPLVETVVDVNEKPAKPDAPRA
jgi:hypothetical protein